MHLRLCSGMVEESMSFVLVEWICSVQLDSGVMLYSLMKIVAGELTGVHVYYVMECFHHHSVNFNMTSL